jgi:excisionase family DNA binding protein
MSSEGRGGLAAERHVRIAEAAEFLGLSRSKIYQLMDAGELAYAKFGRSRRIPFQILMEFAAKCLVAR